MYEFENVRARHGHEQYDSAEPVPVLLSDHAPLWMWAVRYVSVVSVGDAAGDAAGAGAAGFVVVAAWTALIPER